MTTMRMLLPFLATACALAAIPARAEMKNEWVEYSQGDVKLKGYMVYATTARTLKELFGI